MTSILVIGGGLAGLFTALKLAPLPVTVLSGPPITKNTASAWAQGGIAAALGPEDSIEAHVKDSIEAGAGLVDERIARLVAEDAPDRIRDLVDIGVPFDRTSSGFFALGREGAHSENRIVRVSGDRAGAAVMQAIGDAVHAMPSIKIIEGYTAVALDVDSNRVRGVTAWSLSFKQRESIRLNASQVVLATGGVGGLFAVTTNPKSVRGEGLGMALRAGAVAADCEFVQFHPTGMDIDQDPAPLATEALRGEGAVLINSSNVRFMKNEHSLAELAPRNVVAMGIHRERLRSGKVYLDCRDAIGAAFPEHFPTVYASCKRVGLDPVKEPIPVAPAAHYHMGGLVTDAFGETTISGLWACGEVASTGAHGANRLASNSLLEALVFANQIATQIKSRIPDEEASDVELSPSTHDLTSSVSPQLLQKLRRTMADHVGVIRNAESLSTAMAFIEEAGQNCDDPSFKNALAAAKVIVASAQLREESRGGHYRSDYPEPRPAFCERRRISLREADEVAAKSPKRA